MSSLTSYARGVSNALFSEGPQAFHATLIPLKEKYPEWVTFFKALYALRLHYGTSHPNAGKPDYEKLKSLFSSSNYELRYYARELVYQYFHEGDWLSLNNQQKSLNPQVLSLAHRTYS